MKNTLLIVLAFYTFGLTSFLVASEISSEPIQKQPEIQKVKTIHNIDLSELDKLDCVYWWEIQNDTLKIWTAEDEKKSEAERHEYIRSLDPDGWE